LAAILLAAVWSSQPAVGEGTTNTVALPSGLESVTLGSVPLAPELECLQPGDTVTVLMISSDPFSGRACTAVVEEAVLVLAVDRAKQGAGRSMTLAVRPDLAEPIVAANRAQCLHVSPTVAGRGADPGTDQTRSLEDWRALALEHLTKRYPNIRPDEFVYQRAILNSPCPTAVTLVFADRESRYRPGARPVRPAQAAALYRQEYHVRMAPDGELDGIQEREWIGNILRIWPARDDASPARGSQPSTGTVEWIIIRPAPTLSEPGR